MYTIKIKNLRTPTIVGVYAWEKKSSRIILLNIEITIQDTKAGESDDIRDAVDYSNIEEKIIKNLANTDYNLIECLVTDIARIIFEIDNRICDITIEADKEGALRHAESVAILQTFKRN